MRPFSHTHTREFETRMEDGGGGGRLEKERFYANAEGTSALEVQLIVVAVMVQ